MGGAADIDARLAPAQRPPGDRGPRAPAAIGVAIWSVVAVWVLRGVGAGGGGGGDSDGGPDTVSTTYSYGGNPATFDLQALVIAIALAACAAALWAGRDARILRLAWVVVALVTGAAIVLAQERRHRGEVTRAQISAIAVGMTRSEVRDRLGAPAGEGSATGVKGDLDCDVYLRTTRMGHVPEVLCFGADRLRHVEGNEWQ